MKAIKLYAVLVVCLAAASCGFSIDKADLTGQWKYIEVKNPHAADQSDSITDAELQRQSPSIVFKENDSLKILWDHKLLSHGKYRLEGNIIRYKEDLPDGKTREFPFLILKINERSLKFQTMVQDLTVVTAVKQ